MANKSDKQKKAEREAKLNEYLEQFEKLYGSNDKKLEAWQALCRDLGEPEGKSTTQCKKNLKGVWVNIFDFIDAKKADAPVPRRTSLNNLRNYSKRNGKIFPLRKAKNNLLLRGLLVHMFAYE